MKTSELTGAALDWAVAKCEGVVDERDFAWYWDRKDWFEYSTDWVLGGPIIEREAIEIVPSISGKLWYADMAGKPTARMERCPTPLIAAMRCYVASKLGDEVDVPKEVQ